MQKFPFWDETTCTWRSRGTTAIHGGQGKKTVLLLSTWHKVLETPETGDPIFHTQARCPCVIWEPPPYKEWVNILVARFCQTCFCCCAGWWHDIAAAWAALICGITFQVARNQNLATDPMPHTVVKHTLLHNMYWASDGPLPHISSLQIPGIVEGKNWDYSDLRGTCYPAKSCGKLQQGTVSTTGLLVWLLMLLTDYLSAGGSHSLWRCL